MVKLAVLDLAPVPEGSNPADALERSVDLAQHAEKWGYERYWIAEHHNMPGIASSATAVLIGHIAARTEKMRIGSGGIMLPNHAPLVIAEQFGTLASLFPGRIDLGLGRAPGTDQLTMQALRRTLTGDISEFPRDVVELQHYLKDPQEGQRVVAVPGAGTKVPIWILGSSLFGAQLAAMLGLPFSFASHFAPDAMEEAIEIYRNRFEPSDQLSHPYLMLGFNVWAADTSEEARYIRSSSLQSFLRRRRGGQPGQLPPPVHDLEYELTPQEQQRLDALEACAAIGTPEEVKEQTQRFADKFGADELIVVGSIYEHGARLRSYEILADVLID